MKRYTLFLILMSILLLTACGESLVSSTMSTPMSEVASETVDATPLPPAPAGKTVVADGQLASPYPKLPLSFGGGVSGELIALNVKAGDSVTAGAVLAELDTEDLQRTVDNAQLTLDRAILDESRAQTQWAHDVADAEQALLAAQRTLSNTLLQDSNTSIVEARAALERARKVEADAKNEYETPLFGEWTPDDVKERNYESWQNAIQERQLAEMRLTDTLDARAGRELDKDSRAADVTQAERKLIALQEGLALSYARAIEDTRRELAKAQRALADALLIAPWDAIVLSVEVAPRATLAANTPVATLLSVEEGLRFITQNLSEQHVATVRPGQEVSIILRSYPERTFEGTVEAIIPQTETQQSTDARFTVRIQIAETDAYLLPGLTGRAEILAEE